MSSDDSIRPAPAPASMCLDRQLLPLRLALGLVYVWFGLPKLIPGLSPAEELACATVPFCDPAWFVPALGGVEAFIGLTLLSRRSLAAGLLLMAVHMLGTALPLFTLPGVMWKSFPVATLEGQYVLKNVVLVTGAVALASAHLRAPQRRVVTRPLRGGPPNRRLAS